MGEVNTVLPAGIETLPEWGQALAVFLSTFILEDVATVGAGFLVAAGSLGWGPAFWAAFIGVWLGDAGLYALARGVGRRWFERWSWYRRFRPRIEESERWFASRGASILVVSRCIPGARLPTYLAAGFLRLSLPQFLLVTGLSSVVWTIGVLVLTQLVGRRVLEWLGAFQLGVIAVVAGIVLVLLLLRAVRFLLSLSVSANGVAPVVVHPKSAERFPGAVGPFADQQLLETPSQPQDAIGASTGPADQRSTVLRRTGPEFRPWRASAGQRIQAAFGRWRRWEFWPAWLFYPPVGLWCVWLMIKYRGLRLPTLANPGIFSGGMVGESKMATLRDLMNRFPESTAEAELIDGTGVAERVQSFREICRRRQFTLPVILKPDLGQRGLGVKVIHREAEAKEYFSQTAAPVVVQRHVPGPFEAGIFYYRFPHESRGRIFAITEKQFATVTGDGVSTAEELVWRDKRARYVAEKYLRRLGPDRFRILGHGESLRLVQAGNHAQGCIFHDGWRLWTPALESRIDSISRAIPGFFVGRYDVRYDSEEAFRLGAGFQIIELNGASAEATNIYDARNSLVAAYRVLFRQWELIFAIGAANRTLGLAPTPFREFWRKWRQFAALSATYPAAD